MSSLFSSQAGIRKKRDAARDIEQEAEVFERKAQGLARDLDRVTDETKSVQAKKDKGYVLSFLCSTFAFFPTLGNV